MLQPTRDCGWPYSGVPLGSRPPRGREAGATREELGRAWDNDASVGHSIKDPPLTRWV